MKKFVLFVPLLALFLGCGKTPAKDPELGADDLSSVVSAMTEVMVHDVTNPPLGSRFFAYACLAAYEVVAQNDESFPTMQGRLNEYPVLQPPDSIKGYATNLSALLAMMEVAGKMQPSGKEITAMKTRLLDSLVKAGVDENVVAQSQKYAQAISRQILAYAKSDRYNKISNYPRYAPTNTNGSWYPTPPAYFAAVEPLFHTIRPFTLDSSAQFKPQPPVPFSERQNSEFYKMLQGLYRHSLTEDEKQIAAFWDCNPFAVQDNGHLLVGLKKISPGAHWMGIAGIACKQSGKNFAQTVQVFTTVAVGLMDGFLSCWDEKYRSNRIRPETAIRKYIDASWTPLLQTPPFPEYLSGHSTVSGASATILTHFFGDDFAYTDTVEVRYGLPARKFTSFKQAAQEAAISRYYGGIHFMDAIENGLVQGEQVGSLVVRKVAGK
ncbi:vanadium-dependent haloperoxidase [Paracnuella aquatica]|uniref:vanadium-dependent haloperoxidase n=1 Tax=Paracnuella aquatica TaxID=2268757 RepID=UPI000DEF84BC|nr:vanadium-dependent haloperoxidase [Paracnuella aquatica]RPD46645.1 phosphatase PAP2 family protein [Paracnuella aquatica]